MSDKKKLMSHPMDWQASWRDVFVLAALTIAALLFFRTFDQLERDLTSLFVLPVDCVKHEKFNAQSPLCGWFYLQFGLEYRVLRKVLITSSQVFFVGLLLWQLRILLTRRDDKTSALYPSLIGTISLLLGPVLLVNIILKPNWGRPRPYQTSDFGGYDTYVLPGTISDQCQANCSFVSGDVAIVAWALFVVPFLPKRWRWPAGLILGLCVVTIAVLRVGAGRHFLSDTVLAALFTWLIIALTSIFLVSPYGLRFRQLLAKVGDRFTR